MNPATLIIGPLVGPECRRSARRGRVFIIRALAGLLMGLFTIGAFYWWMLSAAYDSTYRPELLAPLTTGLLAGIAVTVAFFTSPSLLAGTLAGEKERGSIGLLLSTRVDAREIVLGRLFSKLCEVGFTLLTGVPFLLLFGWLSDFSLWQQATLLAIPTAVAFGAGGLAIGASAVAKRGRNALMGVYFLEIGFLVVSMLGLAPGLRALFGGVSWANPYVAIDFLVRGFGTSHAWVVIGSWMFLGLAGSAFAAWRLRPAFLGTSGGRGKKSRRQWFVPPVDEASPMLWKELHIEQVNALGWFGRILGWVAVLYLGLGSLILAGLAVAVGYFNPSWTNINRLSVLADDLYYGPSVFISLLIQLSVGLRAAVAIASERERATWDALLTSPLEGKEILWGKLWGSLNSLRWLVAAALISWIVAVLLGGMPWTTLFLLIGVTITASIFIASVGVYSSLSCATATRAMTTTFGWWLGAFSVAWVLAWIAMAIFLVTYFFAFMLINSLGNALNIRRMAPPNWIFFNGSVVIVMIEFLAFAAFLITSSWIRFDTVAGRIPADGAAPVGPIAVEGGQPDIVSDLDETVAESGELRIETAAAEMSA